MSYEQSGYIPSPQQGAVPPPDAQMPGVMPQPGMPYQQQAWGGQPMPGYAPAMYAPPPPPAPSMFNSPAVLVSKLPLLALIGLIGFSLGGLLYLVSDIVSATGYHVSMGTYILNGVTSLIQGVVTGVVWFAVLMTLKYFADKHEAPAE
ncbi:MAG: hypothetical protein FWD63_03305 [Propionibacteriaceae bacterium]|nr:hypothetical protein [Propionibacteriaceae bacterium]